MYKLPIALLLAGAAAASAFAVADQPNQNRFDAQHHKVQHPGERPNSTHVGREAGERRLVNQPAHPSAPISTQTPTQPRLRPGRRIENAHQRRTTTAPNIERRHVKPPVAVQRSHPPVVSRVPRIGTEPPLRAERAHRPRPQWNRSWRDNRHYDWQHWRQRNRSAFHVRPYRDPYGWAYRLFSIGWRLWPQYYGSSYWIADPSMYRLPPAPPGSRWIRYYNDALLVDMWTGEVIDVIPNFFW